MREVIQLYVLFCFLVILVFGNMAEHFIGGEDWLMAVLLGVGSWLFLTVPVGCWIQEHVDRWTGYDPVTEDDVLFRGAVLALFGLPINVTIVHGLIS